MVEKKEFKNGLTYRRAGVNIEAGKALVSKISSSVKKTSRPELVGSIGGFGAAANLPSGYKKPAIVVTTDGVGTKLRLAIDFKYHKTIGQDLVAMCVNDLLVMGAEPFLFLDYYATGKLNIQTASTVISSIATACKIAGCSLVGGETAEMPGIYKKNDFDLAGFCVGVLESSSLENQAVPEENDILIGLRSSGPHSNGYSLIRQILSKKRMNPKEEYVEGSSILDALMTPTKIYKEAVLNAFSTGKILGCAHVTGGGLTENLPRSFPENLTARIELNCWKRPDIFKWLQEKGEIEEHEMLTTFNCGIGFVLIIKEESKELIKKTLKNSGENPVELGRLVKRADLPVIFINE